MKTGFKAFDKNLRCNGFQYKVGKTYKTNEVSMCKRGFHYCKHFKDVYNYYPKNAVTPVAEVEDLSDTSITENDKTVTKKLRIIRLLASEEIVNKLLNETNSGHYNSGNYNSGYYNSGHRNSGYSNSGHRNSGNYNSGNYNSGYFNSDTPTVRLFNKQSELKFSDEIIAQLRRINVKPILSWIPLSIMTDEEKTNNPQHVTLGGYLKNTGKTDYSCLTEADKQLIKSLPGYDHKVFKEITGISLNRKK